MPRNAVLEKSSWTVLEVVGAVVVEAVVVPKGFLALLPSFETMLPILSVIPSRDVVPALSPGFEELEEALEEDEEDLPDEVVFFVVTDDESV